MTNKLLSDDEWIEEIGVITDNLLAYGVGAKDSYDTRIFDLINTQKRLYAEMVVGIDTDVDIPEALKKIYNDGYSKGYNDRTYENSYNSVDFRMAEAIAPAVAKVRSRYDKQLKALEEVWGKH